MPPLEEFVDEIAPLWESHWLTNMGVKHKTFEAELKNFLGVDDLALYTNGHSALECVLEAMDLKGKVITTPFTFASTTHAIVRKGLTPVFADIKEDNYTIDPESIERLIDSSTCAIMPVHVYGNLCDVDAIEQIAKKYNLRVIYDAAHAFGVSREEADGSLRSAATFGDASMFSFHATKAFNTIEGGAVCFKDTGLHDTLNQWKNFGITGTESVEYVGGNAKMNEFCAAMGLCNLRHFNEEIAKRKKVAERYYENLEGVAGIKLCKPSSDIVSNYAYMPVVFDETICGCTRNEVFEALAAKEIGARKYFYPLVSDYKCYRGRYDSDKTPVAQWVSNRVLTLPMYADLALEDVDLICDIVKGCAQ
jgi:dTDP-4-amino-4,6-dideoxygalactose transaminase